MTLKELLAEPRGRMVFGIDGNCCAGKSTAARSFANINVVSIDHFYKPFDKRKEEIAGNIDFARLIDEVLMPYLWGMDFSYDHYDPHVAKVVASYEVDSSLPLCIEGTYSLHPCISDYYDLKVFLSCSNEVQLKRLKQRQGGDIADFLTKWLPKERAYFAHFAIEETADQRFNTDLWF